MRMKIFQKGFNYSQDGSGNRMILHLQGCNMNCPWCSNPEGMPLEGAILTQKEWLEESCCPHGAVKEGSLTAKGAVYARQKSASINADRKGLNCLAGNTR